MKYVARRKHAVLKLVPHIPATETTERSSYSILLLHSDWGTAGESRLLGDCQTAIFRLAQIRDTLPEYVLRNLGRKNVSEGHLDNTGEPVEDVEVNETDFDEYAAESFANMDIFENTADESDDDQPQVQVEVPQIDDCDAEPLQATNKMLFNTPISQMAFLNNFVSNLKVKAEATASNGNRLTEAEVKHVMENPGWYFAVANKDKKQDILDTMIATCNERQADTVNVVRSHLEGTNPKQMIMFLSGEGGTGKSHVIKILTLIASIHHGKQQGRMGAVCIAAPTGGSAHNIGGMTWQSACGKCTFDKSFKDLTSLAPSAINKLRKDFKGCKFIILDEISLLCLEDINEINCRLQVAMENKEPFGGLHVLFAGDLYQMRCMGGQPVYTATENWTLKQKDKFCTADAGRKLFTSFLTHFKMLTKNVRAQSTEGEVSVFANVVSKIRLGDTSGDVLETINTRCTTGIQQAMRLAHPSAVWIAPTHKNIKEINEAYAQKLSAEGGKLVRLIADHVGKNATIPRPDEKMRDKLYSVRGDEKGSSKGLSLNYMDVQRGTRVRLTRNICVALGLNTGAMGTIHGFVYQGDGPDQDNLLPSNFAKLDRTARELPILLVRMDGIDDESDPFPSCSKETTRLIPIAAEASKLKVKNNYHRVMYPLMVAHARTGHSIQGYTAIHGAVIYTGSPFFAGEYVAISRAKCLAQLWLLSPLLAHQVTAHAQQRVVIEIEYARLLALFPYTATELPL